MFQCLDITPAKPTILLLYWPVTRASDASVLKADSRCSCLRVTSKCAAHRGTTWPRPTWIWVKLCTEKKDYQIINTKTCRLCILCILQVIYNVDISIEHIYHDIIYMDISIVKHLIWYEYIINTLTVLVSPGCLARRKVARDRSENQFLKAQT